MVRKSDWKTMDMPAEAERFTMEYALSESDLEKLREGHLPREMEDKWFVYFEDGSLFVHRSWTGICVYVVSSLRAGRVLEVTVNRNSEQYRETNVERDKLMLQIVLNHLLEREGVNGALMKEYIKLGKLHHGGQGRKCVLLHGLGQSPSSWRDTVPAIGGKYDVRCPDLSEWLHQKAPCYSSLYQALEEYCRPLDEPIHLCGLSLGGVLALQYVLEHPQKVRSLVLIGTQYTMPKGLLRVQNMVFHLMPAFSFQRMGFQKREVIQLSKSMMDLDFQKDLNKIACPVLVVCGEKDKANRAASIQLKERIPHAESSILANAGHEVNLDCPVELGKVLKDFFERSMDTKNRAAEALPPERRITTSRPDWGARPNQ